MAECKKEKDESDYINNGADGDAESVAEATNEPGVVKGPGQENKLLGNTNEEGGEEGEGEEGEGGEGEEGEGEGEVELAFGVGSIQLADNPQPKKRVTLMKKGLEPKEFEKLLTSKVEVFISDKPNIDVIQSITQKIVLREKSTGAGGELDQRRSANEHQVRNNMIPNKSDSPSKVNADTSNKQGVIRFKKELNRNYHDEQKLFFQSLADMHMLPPDTVVQGSDVMRNGSKIITPEDFCEFVDDVTKMFVKKYSSDFIPVEDTRMQAIYTSCEKMCMGRLDIDMIIPNDMLNLKSYATWRSHVLVLSCFAAFLYVYLENKCRRGKGNR